MAEKPRGSGVSGVSAILGASPVPRAHCGYILRLACVHPPAAASLVLPVPPAHVCNMPCEHQAGHGEVSSCTQRCAALLANPLHTAATLALEGVCQCSPGAFCSLRLVSHNVSNGIVWFAPGGMPHLWSSRTPSEPDAVCCASFGAAPWH